MTQTKPDLSVGRKLAGMESWGSGSSSGLKLSSELRSALGKGSGWIKVVIQNDEMCVGEKGSGTSIDSLRSHIDDHRGAYFVVARRPKTLLVCYLPDNAPPRQKMLFASSKGALKQAIRGAVEEFNATSKDELSSTEYSRRANAPRPMSDSERAREEANKEEANLRREGPQGNAMLAKLMGGDPSKRPRALPGLAVPNSKPPPGPSAARSFPAAASSSSSRGQSVGTVASRFGKQSSGDSASTQLQTLLRPRFAPGQTGFAALSPELREQVSIIYQEGAGAAKGETSGAASAAVASLKIRREAGELPGLDPATLEEGLSDADFVACFACTREEFAGKPAWKRMELKKEVALF